MLALRHFRLTVKEINKYLDLLDQIEENSNQKSKTKEHQARLRIDREEALEMVESFSIRCLHTKLIAETGFDFFVNSKKRFKDNLKEAV